MARTGQSLVKVATDMNLGLTASQCAKIEVLPDFVATLRGERFKYYAEIERDPNNSKAALVGRLLKNAQELEEKKALKDANSALVAAAKIEGWMDSSTQITVMGDVTAKDIQSMKEKLVKSALASPLAN
jgi:hypothetical protein